MHGMIFNELQKYVTDRLGAAAWPALLQAAGQAGMVYLPSQEYQDTEIVKLVATACRITRKPSAEILEDFGRFIVPDLMKIYDSVIEPQWRTADLLENVEGTIHTVVRLKNPGAHPPTLVMTRTGPKSVELTYRSARKMCSLAKGMGKGVGDHYRETVTAQETACMLSGEPACKIDFTVR